MYWLCTKGVCSSDYDEENKPFASYETGPPRSTKGNGYGYSRNKETRQAPQNNYKVLPQVPDLNGLHVDERHHTSEQLSTYNRLLKDGRYLAITHMQITL